MTNKRVFQQPLQEEWAYALLDCVPVMALPQDDKGMAYVTLGGRCSEARSRWQAVLFEVREVIKNHPLAPLVAQRAAREAGKRGKARLVVNDAGVILLEVSYKTSLRETVEETAKPVVVEKLPTLDLLRAVAVRLGVDISDLGRKKKLIMARLVENGWKSNGLAKAPVAPTPPHKKRVKRAPAITRAKVGPGPFALDQDLGDLFEPPKKSSKKPRVDLEALVAGAVPLDLKEFLKSDDEAADGDL